MAAPRFAPMLADTGRPEQLDGWVAETKLDGWRVLVTVDDGLVVTTRNGHRITHQLPELRALADLGCPAVLDGELVAGGGRCDDFYAITSQLTHRTRRPALTFAAFDLLWLDGHDVTALPYQQRRRLLLDLEVPPPAVVVNSFDAEDLDDVLDACEDHGVEGVVLKRLDGRYEPGRRSSAWRKVKCPHWRTHAARRRTH